MPSNKKIVIIGAGISGLTTAYILFKEGYDVVVLEQKENVGGSIETVTSENLIFERTEQRIGNHSTNSTTKGTES
jgi:protoporphyrinogen oxidase